MLEVLVSFLLIYAIYAFIDWLRNSKKPFKPAVTPHKKIARSIWIYCVFIIAVAITMASITEIDRDRFYRPMYGEYKGWYFPNGRYSDLRIGNIRDEAERVIRPITHNPVLMGRHWEEIPSEEPEFPFTRLLKTFHYYDSDTISKTYGRGIVIRIYDLDNEIADSQGNENSVYTNIINKFVSDSSFYHISKSFAPYSAIETATYATISPGSDNPTLFKKHLTIFANNRAYELNFYVDKEVNRPSGTNTFDYLDAEFIEVAKELDLHSFNEWQVEEANYRHNLNIKCLIFIVLYVICILGALLFAFRYFKNIGYVNPKAAKITKILSIVNFISFLILGISFIAAFCSIHYEYITDMYNYRFDAYINDEYVATSVLCYGAYFLLLIVPTNRFYIKSYTQPKPKQETSKAKRGILYWIVRPIVLISKVLSKWSKAVKDEYNNQISDKS